MDANKTMSGRGRRWARLGGAVVGATAAVVLSLGVSAGSASAATVSTSTASSSTVGVVHPMSVRWQ